MTDPHREHCRRTHRILGQYLAIEAWLRGVDCLVIERYELLRYLGLEKLHGARHDWIQLDLKPWFPYPDFSVDNTKLEAMFLSRVPIENHMDSFAASTEDRVETLGHSGIVVQIFSFGPKLSTEAQIVGYLAQLSAGLVDPDVRPQGQEKIEAVAPKVARKPAKKFVP